MVFYFLFFFFPFSRYGVEVSTLSDSSECMAWAWHIMARVLRGRARLAARCLRCAAKPGLLDTRSYVYKIEPTSQNPKVPETHSSLNCIPIFPTSTLQGKAHSTVQHSTHTKLEHFEINIQQLR
jgi:hypothetical protein